jgi:hypothetical protein
MRQPIAPTARHGPEPWAGKVSTFMPDRPQRRSGPRRRGTARGWDRPTTGTRNVPPAPGGMGPVEQPAVPPAVPERPGRVPPGTQSTSATGCRSGGLPGRVARSCHPGVGIAGRRSGAETAIYGRAARGVRVRRSRLHVRHRSATAPPRSAPRPTRRRRRRPSPRRRPAGRPCRCRMGRTCRRR